MWTVCPSEETRVGEVAPVVRAAIEPRRCGASLSREIDIVHEASDFHEGCERTASAYAGAEEMDGLGRRSRRLGSGRSASTHAEDAAEEERARDVGGRHGRVVEANLPAVEPRPRHRVAKQAGEARRSSERQRLPARAAE